MNLLLMKQRLKLILFFIICLTIFVIYTSSEFNISDDTITYEHITATKAKAIMDSPDPYILLDVRTQEEYDAGHIEGAILLPDYEIGTKAETILDDKTALILIYCRSGRRSKNAAVELAALGYTNIKEFGGIIDWPYEIISE